MGPKISHIESPLPFFKKKMHKQKGLLTLPLPDITAALTGLTLVSATKALNNISANLHFGYRKGKID